MDKRTRTLAAHFFRRFLDNDFMSVDGDRHHALAVAASALLSFTLVVTMLIGVKYVTALPTPGQVSLLSLDDKFLYISWSIGAMALLAGAEWDALVLNARDGAILSPLPVSSGMIFRAKAAALIAFGFLAVLAVNLAPSIVFSSALVAKIVVSPQAFLSQIATHGLVTCAAGAFGFLTILAIRETCRAALGARLFERLSTALQVTVVVMSVSWLCVMPSLAARMGTVGLASSAIRRTPAAWFLGLYEVLSGWVMDALPRSGIPRRLVPFDVRATDRYRANLDLFHTLALHALEAFAVVFVLGAAFYFWNNRRLPPPITPEQNTKRHLWRRFQRIAEQLLVRHPAERVGFFFTLQTLLRNAPHRMSMSFALAIAAAFTSLGLRNPDERLGTALVQAMVIAILLTGFRHASKIPGELRANWIFSIAWNQDARRYLVGVKRAGLISVFFPAVIFVAFLGMILGGSSISSIVRQLVCGIGLSYLGMDVALFGCRTLPFASGYSAGENMKSWLAAAIIGFYPGTLVVAVIAHGAAASWLTMGVFALATIALALLIRTMDDRQRLTRGPLEYSEAASQFQRLDLTA